MKLPVLIALSALALSLVACEKEGLQSAYINNSGDIVDNKGNFVRAQTVSKPERNPEYVCVKEEVWEKLDNNVWIKKVRLITNEPSAYSSARFNTPVEKVVESKICLTDKEVGK